MERGRVHLVDKDYADDVATLHDNSPFAKVPITPLQTHVR